MGVAITTINTSLGNPNSGTGDTIYAAFNKVNNNTSNLATIVDTVNATYANTAYGVFANISVSNRVIGRLDAYTTAGGGLYVDGSPVATAAASFTGGNVPSQSNFQAATSSTSTTTGAVVITGGMGVGGNIYANGSAYSNSVVITTGLYWSGNGVAYATAYYSSGAGNITVSGTNLNLTPTGPGSASVGSSTAIPVITTDVYGRVVYSNTAAVIAPAGTLTGTTLASNVVASSLTSVGTLTGLTTSGTVIAATVTAATIGNAGASLVGTLSAVNVSGTVAYANVAAYKVVTPLSNNQTYYLGFANVTSGNSSFNATTTVNVNPSTGTVSATAVSATALSGTLSTVAQPNITSVGTLTGLTVSGNILPSANASINLGSTTAWWSTIYGKAVQAQYADLAEKYLADQPYPVGTVVAVGGDQEVTACSSGDLAIGVVSANPAYMMNSELAGGTYIALKGRVPVSVIGSVRKGQRLIASSNGCAVVGTTQSNTVFAVALETNTDSGVKLVEAVIL
jgi:hypothetical protein